ncbi:MAG: undecaprenyl-diphosphate phosphatase, partial [Elusimicrobia bacterium]|nr:undecaprenyl-diphosphate phosphatase [Elusimicrobiota bacterium]
DNARLFDGMVLATVPGAMAGLLLADKAETVFRDPHRIALTVAAFGVLLGLADRVGRKERAAESATVREVVLIGLAQALALVPGVSRSGITMTAALLLGFDRVAAARLAFLLAVPITAGAGLHQLKEALPLMGDPAFWAGIAASALVGVVAVKGLLKLLGRSSLLGFAVYRVALGGLLVFFGKV